MVLGVRPCLNWSVGGSLRILLDALMERFLAKRFGLRQGEKLRVIYDCSIAGLKLSVGLSERFQLHTMDELAAMVSRSLNRCDQRRHPKVYGRTYDLKSACKELPVSPADRDILRLAVQSPKSRWCRATLLPTWKTFFLG